MKKSIDKFFGHGKSFRKYYKVYIVPQMPFFLHRQPKICTDKQNVLNVDVTYRFPISFKDNNLIWHIGKNYMIAFKAKLYGKITMP